MSIGLKAAKRIKWKLEDEGILGEEYELCDVIEKELKEKDELAQALSIATCENGELLKYKKALEIFKEKSIDLMALRHAFIMDKEGEASGIEWYNSLTSVKRGVYDTLTQEEYDFLKEVLL